MDKVYNFTAAYPSINEEIKQLGLKSYSYFRTTDFDNLTVTIKNLLLGISNATNHNVAILTSSGTGAMDAAVSNLISRDKKVMVIVGGRFGFLWKEICEAYLKDIVIYTVEPGNNIDIKDLENRISEEKPFALLVQHNETSTMQLFDIKSIGVLCKKYNVKYFLDACSSFAIDHIDVADYSIDVLIFSSQKGLLLPAGLSFVIFKKGIEINSDCVYFNLSKYIKDSGRFIQPFTPPVILMHQLLFQLNKIEDCTIKNWINNVREIAINFRELLEEIPASIVPKNPSNCGTVFQMKGVDNSLLCKYLQNKNIYVVNSRGWWGDYISVGHIGDIKLADNRYLIDSIKGFLNK
jgi:aspartate aminotransferase-like enzyme